MFVHWPDLVCGMRLESWIRKNKTRKGEEGTFGHTQGERGEEASLAPYVS